MTRAHTLGAWLSGATMLGCPGSAPPKSTSTPAPEPEPTPERALEDPDPPASGGGDPQPALASFCATADHPITGRDDGVTWTFERVPAGHWLTWDTHRVGYRAASCGAFVEALRADAYGDPVPTSAAEVFAFVQRNAKPIACATPSAREGTLRGYPWTLVDVDPDRARIEFSDGQLDLIRTPGGALSPWDGLASRCDPTVFAEGLILRHDLSLCASPTPADGIIDGVPWQFDVDVSFLPLPEYTVPRSISLTVDGEDFVVRMYRGGYGHDQMTVRDGRDRWVVRAHQASCNPEHLAAVVVRWQARRRR